jgi:hypothetical protein
MYWGGGHRDKELLYSQAYAKCRRGCKSKRTEKERTLRGQEDDHEV